MLERPSHQLPFDFSHCTRGCLHSRGFTLSTFYSQFWLKLPVLFFAPLSETPSSLLFLQESRGPLIPQKSRWLFFRDIFRPIEFSGRSSFISAPLTPTFIPVLGEGALLPLHLCIITFLQLLHVFCSSKTSFFKKKGFEQRRVEMPVQVIGSFGVAD